MMDANERKELDAQTKRLCKLILGLPGIVHAEIGPAIEPAPVNVADRVPDKYWPVVNLWPETRTRGFRALAILTAALEEFNRAPGAGTLGPPSMEAVFAGDMYEPIEAQNICFVVDCYARSKGTKHLADCLEVVLEGIVFPDRPRGPETPGSS